MPHVRSGQADIYWRADGNPSLPALLLSNSIGTDFSIWDNVLPRLMRHFWVIRMDTRGHGASAAPEGDYTLQQLADDVDAVVNAAGVESFFFCGVSLGGMIGMQYAIQRPAKLRKLVLCNTSAVMDPAAWETRRAKVLSEGLESIVDLGMSRFFTPEYVARNNVEFQRVRHNFLLQSSVGYAGCCAAIRDMQVQDQLGQIQVPTLVVNGARDVSTPPAVGEAIAERIPGAQTTLLSAAHIASAEVPLAFCDALVDFLLGNQIETENQRYDFGMARRKQVLGADYVESRNANITPFNQRFQAFITRTAWGEVWTSSRFEDTARRIAVLSMMLALGRWEEFELHVGAALRAGVEPEVIEETLVQAAIYCGVPASNTGFKLAAQLIDAHQASLKTS